MDSSDTGDLRRNYGDDGENVIQTNKSGISCSFCDSDGGVGVGIVTITAYIISKGDESSDLGRNDKGNNNENNIITPKITN